MRARLLRWSASVLGACLAASCLLNPKTDDLPQGGAFSPSDPAQPVPTTSVPGVGMGGEMDGLGASPEPGNGEAPRTSDAGVDVDPPSDAGAGENAGD